MSAILKASNEENPRVLYSYSMVQQPRSTVLAWLQAQLSIYIDLNLITPLVDISDTNYWLGKPLLCLAHHFFPDAFNNQDLFNELNTTEDNNKATELFNTRLDIAFDSNLETYFENIQTAIHSTMESTLRDLHIGSTPETSSTLSQQLDDILIPMTKLMHQHDDASSSATRSPSPRIIIDDIHSTVEDLHLPIESRLLRHQSQSLSIEDTFQSLDTQFQSFEATVNEQLPLQVRLHPDWATRLSTLYITRAALEYQIQKGTVGIEFSTTTAYIRNELEFIQAKMLKTTTTDTGIHDLEVRSTKVGALIDKLNPDRDAQQQQQYDALLQKHQLIIAWVDEVRVWFVEAERIRVWIEERIHRLESKPSTNALEEVEFDYSQEQISGWNEDQHELEKEVEAFDAQDMTRLRAHVKALTSSHNKDLSPADTTTIEITFTTLMTLDRLMHLLRRHGYELQMLTLRMAWEQSYHVTVAWVRATADDVKQFVQHKARWRPSGQLQDKNEIIAVLIQFEQQIASFDQGQFTQTVNCYQDLDDNCHVELPTHLESRQVAIEEAFEDLTLRIAFARQVVEQYLVVSDILTKADELKNDGELLRQEMTAAQLDPPANTTVFSERVAQFQEDAVRLVTGAAARVPYPEATHPGDQQVNEESNEAIRMVIGARKSALILFGEALDQGLNSLRRVIQSQKRANQLDDEISRLVGWVDERLKAMEKFTMDALVAGKCALNDTDVARLKKELEGQVTKLNGIKGNELTKIKENIQSLSQSSSTYHPNNSNIMAQIDSLLKNTSSLEQQIKVLEGAFGTYSERLGILNQRILWETQYTKAASWISTTTFEVWDFVAREAQWRMATTMDEDRNDKQWNWFLKQEWTSLESKLQDFDKSQLSVVSDTFIELKRGFESPVILQMYENRAEEENPTFITSEHLQRRQDMLNQNYTNLHDLALFAEKVIEQHAALTDFTAQVQLLQKQGQQLIIVVQQAILNVMALDDHQHIVKTIQSFGQDVIQLWMESGSQLPYPQCPEDARATRPSTNDDEISTEIATAVYKMYTELQELVKRLSELVQTLDIAMVYRCKIEHWCQETRTTVTVFKELTTIITSYEFDLSTSNVSRDNQVETLEQCQQKQIEFDQQLEHYRANKYEPVKEQLNSLNEACHVDACRTVDVNITQEPWADLEEAWKVLLDSLMQYKQRLLVCEARQSWHQTWEKNYNILNDLHERLREWNNEKTLWVSKYDNENNDQGRGELDSLVDQCTTLNQELETYIQESKPKLQDTHAKLVQVYHAMNVPENSVVLGAVEQADAEKLVVKLKETLSGQLSEINNIKRRYEWENSVDIQIKLCQDKEDETENFIKEHARWSPSSAAIEIEKVKELHLATAQHIEVINGLIGDEQHLPSTESVFRRKANLETLKDRLKQHDEFLDQVVAQHQALSLLLTDFDNMESKAETTKAEFLSMATPPPIEELQKHKQQVNQVCNSVDHKLTYPVRHYRDHDASCREKDIAHNKFVQDMIKVRQAYLVETGNTLESILKSKERLSRRKAAEESYLVEAKAVELWIDTGMKQLDENKQHTRPEELKETVSQVNALQSSVSAYTSVHNLEVTANKYITLIQQQQGEDDAQEVANSVKLIEDKQKGIIDAWRKLSADVALAQKDLSFELRQAEFMDLVSGFKSQCNVLQDQVTASNLDGITEDIASQWQNEIQALDSKIENIKSKVETEWETQLQDIDHQFSALKAQVQERTAEANYHRLKRSFFEDAEKLTTTILQMEQSLDKLSANPVTIEGDAEQDSLKLEQVSSSFTDICNMMDQQQEVYDEQRSFYRLLQLNKIPDLQQVDERQQTIEKQWKQINAKVAQVKQQYITPLSQWDELHRKLDNIKQESLSGVFERLQQFEHLDKDDASIPAFLDQDSSLLKLLHHRASACLDIATNLPENKDNLSCFQSKYDGLLNDIQEAEKVLAEKKLLAQQEMDVMTCQATVRSTCEKINDQVEAITNERLQSIDNEEDLENVYKTAVKDYVHRDSICQTLNSEVAALKQRIGSFKEKYGDLKDVSLLNAQLDDTQKNLSSVMKESNLVNDFTRKILGHSKSATHILSWLDNCNEAIQNLDNMDEQLDESAISLEISSLTQKLNDFDKVVKQFQDMSEDLINTTLAGQGEALHKQAVDSLIMPKKKVVSSGWKAAHEHLNKVKAVYEKITKNADIERKIQQLTSLIDGSRGYLNDIPILDYDAEPLSDDDDKTQVGEEEKDKSDTKDAAKVEDKLSQDYLSNLPRPNRLKDIQSDLASSEQEVMPQIEQKMKSLASSIYENETDVAQDRAEQYKELEESVEDLKQLFDTKNRALQKSMAIGAYLGVVDDIEILQTSLEEAINQSAPHHSTIIGTLSRTDLHAKLIELDARFKYYEHKILQSISEAQQKVNDVKKVSPKGGCIVADHLQGVEKKWKWIKQQFKTRKIELGRSIDTSLDSKEKEARIRKSSLPTRKATSLLRDRADLSLSKHRLSPTASSASSSSSSSRTTSTTRLPQSRLLAPPPPHQASKSATNLKSRPRASTSTVVKPPPNKYVADPHNDLDIEIGRIVNETPYHVKVKMVPGEVGRYWFGNLNPKLCYCRVLKSKMVMVRVGGGWTELSQFLRDHALLEGDFIPRHTVHKKPSAQNVIPEEDEEPKSPTIQEGFIETHRVDGLRRPATRPVTGSPSHSASTQAGYKEGDKFITVDSYGNQHEVHMRKAPNHYMSRSSSATTNNNTSLNTTHLNDYTKKRIARRKEKKSIPE